MGDGFFDDINPSKLKYTIQGSFLQLAIIFGLALCQLVGFSFFLIDLRFLLGYGFFMSMVSIRTTKGAYRKLNAVLSVQPVFCPHCREKVAMLPVEHRCPECRATTKKEP